MDLVAEMFELRNLVDILIVATLIYLVLLLFRGTVAAQVLKGLAIFGVLVLVASLFNLETLAWIVDRLTTVILIGIIVLFQPELRRGLARLGERSFGKFFSFEGERVIDEVTRAAGALSERRHGAIIVFEREAGLDPFIETGTLLNAEVTVELIMTIFFPKTHLHDGAVIIRGNTLVAAGCILPLAYDDNVKHGTRHRAAMGLSRETDAVIVVVSEETGKISLAAGGKLVQGVDGKTLQEMLMLYVGETRERSRR